MWVAVAVLLSSAAMAQAAVHVKQALRATAHAPRARGTAKLTLRASSKGVFSIVARRLTAGTDYDVVVGGIKVGAVATNARGAGKVVFGSPKRGRRAFLGFDPRGRSIAVRDHDGNDVLDCDMPDGSDDASKVACCIPDDDGVECEDRKPEDCLGEGGTVSSATGCFPDPCTPPSGTFVCCTVDSTCGAFVDDDPAVGCHVDVSADHCAEKHGTVVEATSCDPNPCTPVPPVALVTCCVPEDDDEIECEFRTADRCASKGGTVSTATSCDPNPCGGSQSMSNDDDQGEDEQGDGDHHDGDHCDHHDHDGEGDHDGGDGDQGGGDGHGDD